MERRTFLKTGSLASAGILGTTGAFSQEVSISGLEKDQQKVNFIRDGLDLTNAEYIHLLETIEKNTGIKQDYYSRGGVVEELEIKMAAILGKESAVFMPTGTLANHLALRNLSGQRKRVIVQADSHIYRDSGDCASTLSGLNLIPLNPGEVGFTIEDITRVLDSTKSGRTKTEVGAISIESPFRRSYNRMFDFNTMADVSKFAKENSISMHLDGARLFNACVHSNKSPKEYAQLFDTVYVSLYKNFNAASGAILAGTKTFTKDLYHTRRMFGGGMPSVWPFAAVALNYLDGFLEAYKKSLETAYHLFEKLQQKEQFRVQPFPDGTNTTKLIVTDVNPEHFQSNLKEKNIDIGKGDPENGTYYIKINPSILRKNPEEIASIFFESIK